jgi:hypothetical protein
MQWTTVRLVVSENDEAPSRQEKTHREEAYLRFATRRRNKVLGLEENRTLKTVGAKCRDKNGGRY